MPDPHRDAHRVGCGLGLTPHPARGVQQGAWPLQQGSESGASSSFLFVGNEFCCTICWSGHAYTRPLRSASGCTQGRLWPRSDPCPLETEFFIDNLLVMTIEVIWWTSLAPLELGFPCPGGLLSTLLAFRNLPDLHRDAHRVGRVSLLPSKGCPAPKH